VDLNDSRVVAVTGASGFIGHAFVRRAQAQGRALRRFVHTPVPGTIAMDLARASADELSRALDGVLTVVHLAGRAHVMGRDTADAADAYRRGNAEATERIARAALVAGVRRFIFASTVKVNGERTRSGRPFRPDDAPAPQDAYARSKLAAERALQKIVGQSAMTACVLRLPFVYGAGARGNFRRLVDAVAARRLLPFGAIDNRRSVAGIDTVLDALDAAIDARDIASGVHFVADRNAVSTPQLVRAIAAALGVAPRLVPVPVALLRFAARLAGERDAVMRVTESLEVDTSSLAAATGWSPRPFGIDASMVAREASADAHL
jgi:UDP-N-acetyl-alpha-D-quinovosamine dehydrogenase